MISHVRRIAPRRWPELVMLAAAWGCAPAPDPYTEPVPLTPDQAWVASTCDAGSPADTTGWKRYRIGDITILVAPQYRVSEAQPYTLSFRSGSGGFLLRLHRNARYDFDDANRARRFQNWCRASYGGFPTEVLAWRDLGYFSLVARWEATWGGQDVGKWLFASMGASKVEEARLIRDMLHTIVVAKP